jgi:hypothetical protein
MVALMYVRREHYSHHLHPNLAASG